ncbi:HK97 gp10 family phage protein [Methylobacterium sp. E-045]|uniref:HK97 gp10 family phage protein n=1 Tax=Methylobacterium sp. E-045 TaxID=2836575 RepID=UPI001FB9D162|nr:HK97 gp10 family phage protein [Methylobacterium sp. E-045]MCJ2132454.1 HK97 gp10 family phage protein [Methylobacterium sp. E-045]
MDLGSTFNALGQGQAALGFAPAAQRFRAAPGLLSGLQLLDAAAGVIGVDRISGQLAKYAVKLALRSDHSAEQAAAEMVEEMRASVPQDSGTLFNGITWRKEGKTIIVEATAVREGDDYARWVEFGHHAGGQHADSSYFDSGDHSAIRRRRPSRETEVQPEPFFWDPARKGLAKLRSELDRQADVAAQEEGL